MQKNMDKRKTLGQMDEDKAWGKAEGK